MVGSYSALLRPRVRRAIHQINAIDGNVFTELKKKFSRPEMDLDLTPEIVHLAVSVVPPY
jgi:hypothetical protein